MVQEGKTVLVLGGGVGGLVTANELPAVCAVKLWQMSSGHRDEEQIV